MYNMDPDKLPKKPVTVSLSSANQEIKRWMEQNNYQNLLDAAGMSWDLDIESLQKPHSHDPHGSLWEVRVKIIAHANADQLIKTGTFDAEKDERLLELLGEETLEIAMKPLQFSAPSFEEAKNWLAGEILRLRQSFKEQDLHDVKRQLVGRWVDESRRFGKKSLNYIKIWPK